MSFDILAHITRFTNVNVLKDRRKGHTPDNHTIPYWDEFSRVEAFNFAIREAFMNQS